MKKNEKRGTHKVLWGFIYVITFIAVFIISVVVKLTSDPFHGAYQVKWNDAMGRIYTDVPYGEGEKNKFDLYVPADNTKESYGLIVYIHAGGFTSGDKSDDANILKWLCSKGYVAAGINYTLRTEENNVSVYSQSMEIKEAMPYVVEEAEKLGYKLDKMAVSGGSAGGTLALLYAYRDADTSPVPVTMVFESVGPASFYHEDWMSYGLDKSPEAAAGLFSVMSGNTITPEMIEEKSYYDEVKNISADMWVNENTVPTLIAYGTKDKVCPFGTVRHLVEALEKNNVPYDYIECPHSGHGLQNDNKLYASYMEKLNEYLDRYLPVSS